MILRLYPYLLGQTETATQKTGGGETTAPKEAAQENAPSLVDYFSKIVGDTPWDGWAILFAGILGGLVAGRIVQTIMKNFGERLKARGWQARGSLVQYLGSPANLAIFAAGLYAGMQGVEIKDAEVKTFVLKAVGLLYVISIAWFLFNLVEIFEIGVRRITSDDTIIALIRKAMRIFLLIVFGLFVAENFFGANISAWLAGLGLAGLAVSLAAQDSIKNLFGSVTVVLDRPYGLGDRIKFGDTIGVVEAMGFRSTKLRTMEGHLVTVPNMKLIDGLVENITARPSIRRSMNVTITYDTPPEKIEQAVEIIKGILAEPFMHETFDHIEKPPRVFFNEFNADSLNISVAYWYQLNVEGRDWWTYLVQAQEFNLKLFRAFNSHNISFAFPTQTVYVAGDPDRELSLKLLPTNGELVRN